MSAEFGYTRRWLTNFTWDNNVLQAANQFDTFSITAPNDSRLPEEGARPDAQRPLQRPAERGVAGQQRHHAGQRRGRRLHAVAQRLPAQHQRRMRNGLTLQGGIATGVTEVNLRTSAVSPNSPCWASRIRPIRGATPPPAGRRGPRSRLVHSQSRRLGLGTFRSDKGSPLAANMIFTRHRPRSAVLSPTRRT